MKLVTYRYNEEIRPGVLSSDGTAVFSAEALGYEAADMNQFIDRLEMTGLPALKAALEHADPAKLSDTKHIAPLFADEKEYEAFCARHDRDKIRRKDRDRQWLRLKLKI